MSEAAKGEAPRRNRTKADREKAAGIAYDHTQDRKVGGAARSKAPVSRAGGAQGASGVTKPVISVGPSNLPMLRTSERSTFKRCRFLWRLEFVDLRKPTQDTPPLMFGSMIHIALAGYYKKGIKRGPSPVDGFERAVAREAIRVSENTGIPAYEIGADWNERIELGVAMMENYVATYGADEEWEVLATEFPFQVIVPHPRDGITPWFWYTGINDLLVKNRSTSKKMIVDHKTAAAITTKYLALDEQTTAYWTWGVEALYKKAFLQPGEKLDGLLFNFLRKAKPDDRPFKMVDGRKYFLNKPTKSNPEGEISKSQPAPYFLREPIWRHTMQKERSRERAIGEMLDIQAVRNEPEDRAAYKNAGKFTCPGCWAFDICQLHEIGADYRSLIEQTTRTWDPYEAHEIYFGEAR